MDISLLEQKNPDKGMFVSLSHSKGKSQGGDDLSFPVELDKVRAQLKRLPLQSAPGPDEVPY